MAQYDVYKTNTSEYFYVCELQNDIHSNFQTVVTIPLFPVDKETVSKLNPIIDINGKDYFLKVQQKVWQSIPKYLC